MKKFKELEACIAQLRALQAGSRVEPEQKEYVELAIDELRKLRRKPHPTQHEVHKSVRVIAEALIKAFLER